MSHQKKKRNTNGCRNKTTKKNKKVSCPVPTSRSFYGTVLCVRLLDRMSYEHMCYMFVRDVILKTDAVYISLFTNRFMACMRGAHSLNRFRGFDQKLRHYFFIKKTNLKWRRSNMFTPISLQICWLYWWFKMLRWIL